MNYLKPKFKPTQNNPNISTDVSHEKKAMKETARQVLSNAFDPEETRMMQINSPIFSQIALVVAGCWHIGGSGVNGVRAKKAIDWINQTANANIVLAGDSLDVAGGVTKATHSRANNQRSLKYLNNLLWPIRRKIVAIIAGNHDGEWGNRNQDNQADFSAHLASSLMVEHASYSLGLILNMPSSDFARKPISIGGVITHMNGKGSGKASNAEKTEQLSIQRTAQHGYVPQFAFGAHYHANSSNEITHEVPVYSKNGKLLGMQKITIRTISESTLQENAHYSAATGFKTADSNVYFNVMKAVKNPLYKNSKNEMEYILKITRVPMFMENSNEYTTEALEYMEAFKEPTYLKEQIENEFGNLSYEESLFKLNADFSYNKPKEFLKEKENGNGNGNGNGNCVSKDEGRELI